MELVYAMQGMLPRFTLDVHRALASADIDVFGSLPEYANRPVAVRLEVEATSEADARTRVRAALDRELIRLLPHDFAEGPIGMPGVKRYRDNAIA